MTWRQGGGESRVQYGRKANRINTVGDPRVKGTRLFSVTFFQLCKGSEIFLMNKPNS